MLEFLLQFFLIAHLKNAINSREWRQQQIDSLSPFAPVTGLGLPRWAFTRALRIFWVKCALLTLPLVLVLAGLLSLLQGVSGDSYGEHAVWSFLVIPLGVYAAIAVVIGVALFRDRPGRFPTQAALYEQGIAWVEGDRVMALRFNQVARARAGRGGYLVTARDGREALFHGPLGQREFGLGVEVALGLRVDPNKPVIFAPCPGCGERINREDEYCVFCGSRVAWEEGGRGQAGALAQAGTLARACPRCGCASIQAEDRFCRACGAEVTQALAASAAPTGRSG